MYAKELCPYLKTWNCSRGDPTNPSKELSKATAIDRSRPGFWSALSNRSKISSHNVGMNAVSSFLRRDRSSIRVSQVSASSCERAETNATAVKKMPRPSVFDYNVGSKHAQHFFFFFKWSSGAPETGAVFILRMDGPGFSHFSRGPCAAASLSREKRRRRRLTGAPLEKARILSHGGTLYLLHLLHAGHALRSRSRYCVYTVSGHDAAEGMGPLLYFQTSYRRPPSGRLASQLRALNAADVQLYEHFAQRFEQRVRHFGLGRMARELRLLEERTRLWYGRCVRDTRPPDDDKRSSTRLGRKFWVLMFRPKNDSSEECVRMVLPELVFTERLRRKQSGNATGRH
ncbi:hypothetical protein HPB49_007367 [Dermacentor silvarum]|uniref:Uncharacterized protein n=1 Tax=Dermacentor silvarum TaxID=543639 RepID=A0ACB8DAX3_DERSI|nr:hypothetical protein HPB49_007367 [Dermacentor silvarum]